jgi:hypothetical protein
MARWLTSDYVEKVLIDKGLTAGEAKKLAGQDWFLDIAEKAASGNVPKGMPKEFNEKTLSDFRQKAKAAGEPLADYVQQTFAPQSIKTAPPGPAVAGGVAEAFKAAQGFSQPTPPTPIPTAGGAPTPSPLAAGSEPPNMAGFMQAPQAGGEGVAFNPGGTVGSWWTPERVQQGYDTLRAGGVSDLGAKALMARFAGVEAPAGPTDKNNIGGGHWGIAQWGKARGGKGISTDYQTQLDKVVAELQGPESAALERLNAATTPQEAAIGASSFERAGGYNPKTGADDYVGKTLKAMDRFVPGAGENLFTEVAQAPDTGMPMAPPVGGAPIPVGYNTGSVMASEPWMDPTAMLGAFPLEGEPGAAPPPETRMVEAPLPPPINEPTKYVTGPQSFSTQVPAYSEQFTNPTAPYDWRTGPMTQPPVTSPAPPTPEGSSGWNSIGGSISGAFGGAPSSDTLGVTAGPPGTVADPTQPNTYRPANTMFPQTQSPIQPPQPPMSPFNPATAPALGAPSAPPMSQEAMTSPNAMTDPFAVPSPLSTPPGIDTTHWAGFDPVQQMTNTGWPTASAYAPPVGGAPAPFGMGLPTPNPMGPERILS